MSLVEKLTSINTRLKKLLSDCNAKLSAKGVTEVPTLFDIPTAIESVQSGSSGEIGKPYIDTSKLTNFDYFFYKGSRSEILQECSLTHEGITSFKHTFYSNTGIESIELNTANVDNTGLVYTFSGCTNLKYIKLSTVLATRATTNATFAKCSSLEELIVGSGWIGSLYLTDSPLLSRESLHSIIENLGTTTLGYFTVGSDNLAKIDEEHIAMLNTKKWNYS